MKKADNITVVILTKNEEKDIVDAINNAQKITNNVLIVDSGSEDNTVALAEVNGAKVVYRAWDNDFAAQRNFALKHVATEWVLYLDADERMNDELIENISNKLHQNEQAKYKIIRRNSAFGRDFKYGVLGPDSVIRLFPKNGVKWKGKVHERPIGKFEEKTLKGYLKHYTYTSFDEYMDKMNKYASISAIDRKQRGKKCSVIKDLVLRPIFAFIKMYILKLGILEGWLGLVLSLNYANYTLNKYVKLKMLGDEENA